MPDRPRRTLGEASSILPERAYLPGERSFAERRFPPESVPPWKAVFPRSNGADIPADPTLTGFRTGSSPQRALSRGAHAGIRSRQAGRYPSRGWHLPPGGSAVEISFRRFIWFRTARSRSSPSPSIRSFDLATDQIATSAVRHHLSPKASERRVFRGRANRATCIDPLNFSVPFQSFGLIRGGLVSRIDKWMLRPRPESWQGKNAKLIHNFHFGGGQRWISPSMGAVRRAFQPIIGRVAPAASAAMHSA